MVRLFFARKPKLATEICETPVGTTKVSVGASNRSPLS